MSRLRQGEVPSSLPTAMEPSVPLSPIGWGYLTSDALALPLESGRRYSIGRRPGSDLLLKSRSVSADHAEIEVSNTGRTAYLKDLGSLNGCFINNLRIKDSREPLRHGDNVRFGFDGRVWMVDCTRERMEREALREGKEARARGTEGRPAAGLPRDTGPDAWVH
eukprot:scaffold103628_cov25-Tisochrysis_lutea.AAC.1